MKQDEVYAVIKEHPGCTSIQIAKIMNFPNAVAAHAHGLSVTLKRLVKSGRIVRSKDSRIRPAYTIALPSDTIALPSETPPAPLPGKASPAPRPEPESLDALIQGITKQFINLIVEAAEESLTAHLKTALKTASHTAPGKTAPGKTAKRNIPQKEL